MTDSKSDARTARESHSGVTVRPRMTNTRAPSAAKSIKPITGSRPAWVRSVNRPCCTNAGRNSRNSVVRSVATIVKIRQPATTLTVAQRARADESGAQPNRCSTRTYPSTSNGNAKCQIAQSVNAVCSLAWNLTGRREHLWKGHEIWNDEEPGKQVCCSHRCERSIAKLQELPKKNAGGHQFRDNDGTHKKRQDYRNHGPLRPSEQNRTRSDPSHDQRDNNGELTLSRRRLPGRKIWGERDYVWGFAWQRGLIAGAHVARCMTKASRASNGTPPLPQMDAGVTELPLSNLSAVGGPSAQGCRPAKQ